MFVPYFFFNSLSIQVLGGVFLKADILSSFNTLCGYNSQITVTNKRLAEILVNEHHAFVVKSALDAGFSFFSLVTISNKFPMMTG